jgi:hypothetical protein
VGAGRRVSAPAPQLPGGGGEMTCLHVAPTIRPTPMPHKGPVWVRPRGACMRCAQVGPC